MYNINIIFILKIYNYFYFKDISKKNLFKQLINCKKYQNVLSF